MERRPEGYYSTSFEDLLPEIASLVQKNPNQVHQVKIERFGGQTFGNLYVSGSESGDIIRMQVDGVEPLALGSFFLAMASDKGEIHPGGIYVINYAPKEICWSTSKASSDRGR